MSWHLPLFQLLCFGVAFILRFYVRRQPALNEAQRKDFFGVIYLNFILCMAGMIFYFLCRDDAFFWSVTYQKQDYGIFYRLGVQQGDWLAVAAAKYLCCSLAAFVLFLLINGLNYLLLERSRIERAKTRAVMLALMCSFCFLTGAAYGSYLFYVVRI